MTQLVVYKTDGSRSEPVEIAEGTFGTVVKKALMKEYVLMHLANQRHGCAAVKDRSKVIGSGRKLFRQKGTGNARAGSRKSPIRRGGGTVFGPKPRDFSYSIPKKAKREALRSALLAKFNDGQVLVVDELTVKKPATREIARTLKSLGIHRTCLLVVPEHDGNLHKSTRNIPGVHVLPVGDLNAYDVLVHRHLLVTRKAMEKLQGAFPG